MVPPDEMDVVPVARFRDARVHWANGISTSIMPSTDIPQVACRLT
jgi:hypothetical protein